MMKAIVVAAALVAGCGIPEDVYNARVSELNKLKKEHADMQSACDRDRKDCVAEKDSLKKKNLELTERLAALGQDLSSTTANLDSAKKRMDEMAKAQAAAEKRAAQFREMLAKFKS